MGAIQTSSDLPLSRSIAALVSRRYLPFTVIDGFAAGLDGLDHFGRRLVVQAASEGEHIGRRFALYWDLPVRFELRQELALYVRRQCLQSPLNLALQVHVELSFSG